MKMEPGRPASPAGGARPDPDPDPEPEPGGPHRPAAAPAPRRTLGAPEPGACADARGAANPGPGPRPPCAAEPDGVCPPPCPDAAPLRGRALGHGPLAGGDVGLFPGFPAPAGGELALDVGPEAPGRPPDFGHPCPLATEPAACPEDGPRLRAVFDALDGDGDGLVRIEDFVQFATVYGADQVSPSPRAWRGVWGLHPPPRVPAWRGVWGLLASCVPAWRDVRGLLTPPRVPRPGGVSGDCTAPPCSRAWRGVPETAPSLGPGGVSIGLLPPALPCSRPGGVYSGPSTVRSHCGPSPPRGLVQPGLPARALLTPVMGTFCVWLAGTLPWVVWPFGRPSAGGAAAQREGGLGQGPLRVDR